MADQPSQQNVKVPFDPGWNDPPPLSYSQQSQTNRPRNILKKRVAFPLSPAGTQQTTVPRMMPPAIPTTNNPAPIPIFNPLVTPSNSQAAPNISEEPTIDSEAALKEVIDTLTDILNDSSELESSANDIRKRIAGLEDSWKNGKLPVQAQNKMLKFTSALKEGRSREAEDLHKALAVEQASSVGTLMPALRKLMHHSIAKQELLSIDKEDS